MTTTINSNGLTPGTSFYKTVSEYLQKSCNGNLVND